jgi:hypothetical protein
MNGWLLKLNGIILPEFRVLYGWNQRKFQNLNYERLFWSVDKNAKDAFILITAKQVAFVLPTGLNAIGAQCQTDKTGGSWG